MLKTKLARLTIVKNVTGKGLGINAVMPNGEVVTAKSSMHLMLLRRLTTKWVDDSNNTIPHTTMYERLCKEVGYYV